LIQVISPSLELENNLFLDTDSIKREEDWDPIIKGLRRGGKELRVIRLISDIGPALGMKKIHTKKLIEKTDGWDKNTESSPSLRINDSAKSKLNREPAALRMTRISAFLFSALRECLSCSYSLRNLEIIGIKMSSKALNHLSHGLAKNHSIRTLSLARSNLGDDGLQGEHIFNT
jgi:hypothetical protein